MSHFKYLGSQLSHVKMVVVVVVPWKFFNIAISVPAFLQLLLLQNISKKIQKGNTSRAIMSEQMKYLVAELNKAPYNRNYNLISFDALQGDQLLQILSDVLAVIDAKNKIDIREEEAESTVIRILGMLRILKYKPPDEISHNFRQGLVEGHKQVKMKCTVWKIGMCK